MAEAKSGIAVAGNSGKVGNSFFVRPATGVIFRERARVQEYPHGINLLRVVAGLPPGRSLAEYEVVLLAEVPHGAVVI